MMNIGKVFYALFECFIHLLAFALPQAYIIGVENLRHDLYIVGNNL